MSKHPYDRPWTDPWIEGSAEAQAMREATFDGEPPPGMLTRWNCVKTGAVVFFIPCLLLILVAEFFARGRHDPLTLIHGLWVLGAPTTVIGSILGFVTYTEARAPKPPREFRWAIWLLAFCTLGWVVIALYYQIHRRERILRGAPIGWKMPAAYALLGLLSAAGLAGSRGSDARLAAYVFSAIFSLFIGECILVNIIAHLRNERRLLPPPSHKFQFSLGAMLASVLAVGTYVSGLVVIFGKP